MGPINWAKRARRSLLAILTTPALVLVLWLASAPLLAAEEVSELDKFQLFNSCNGVALLVEGLDANAEIVGLTRKEIIMTVRNRLRGARIYKTEPAVSDDIDSFQQATAESQLLGRLYINVTTVANVTFGISAFVVSIQFRKVLADVRFGINPGVRATTWQTTTTGMTNWQTTTKTTTTGWSMTRGSGLILSVLSRNVDKFIDEYLRVNTDACK